jgi:hypothetical protein
MNIDCPDGMTCHPHASCQDRDSFTCGTTWDEAAATCSDPCPFGEHSKEKKKEIGQTSPGDIDDAAIITTQVFKAKLDQLSNFRQLSDVKLQQLQVDVKKLFDDATAITTQVFKAKLDQLSSFRQLSDVKLQQLLVDVKKLLEGDETKSCSGTTIDDEVTIFSTDEDQTQFTMDETQFGDQTRFTINEDQTQFTIASDDQETQFSSDSQSLFSLIDNVLVVVPMKPWKEYTDPTTGRKYYSNGVITTWKRPDDSSSIIVAASPRMSAIKSQLKNEKKQFQLDSIAKNNGRFKSKQERMGIKSFFKRNK